MQRIYILEPFFTQLFVIFAISGYISEVTALLFIASDDFISGPLVKSV